MFFQTADNIPHGLGFAAYGPTHILWLFAGLLLWVSACTVHKRLDGNKRRIMLTVLGMAIFLMEIAKDLVLILTGQFGWGHLPFHLCGINILLIAFDVLRPTKTVRSFLYYFAIPGAALALLFPNWTAVPFLNFFHMHSFSIHILLVLYPLLLVTTGQVDAHIRSAIKNVLLLILMAIPIYFLNLLWDTNFMFLMEPDSGNPLALFKTLLGSHLWGFPILLPVVILVMYIPILIQKKLKKQRC